MTVKNFLRTAVLGIAFLFSANNSSIASPVNSISDQISNEIKKSTNKKECNYIAPSIIKSNQILNIAQSINQIIRKAEQGLISTEEYNCFLSLLTNLKDTSDKDNLTSNYGSIFINVKDYIIKHENEINNLLTSKIN